MMKMKLMMMTMIIILMLRCMMPQLVFQPQPTPTTTLSTLCLTNLHSDSSNNDNQLTLKILGKVVMVCLESQLHSSLALSTTATLITNAQICYSHDFKVPAWIIN